MRKASTLINLAIVLFISFNSYSQIGGNDPSFNSSDIGYGQGDGAGSYVYSTALQSDGKIVIGGLFGTYNSATVICIARLNADGTLDNSFNTGSGTSYLSVQAVTIQSDGKIIIAGDFTTYNGTGRNRIARLNSDGTLDTSFDPGTGADNTISKCVLQPDGKIIIAGNFTTYNGTSRVRIARLNTDGTLDTSFDPGTGANAYILAASIQTDGNIIIGGSFTTYNGTSINRIARLNSDGSIDATFNVGTGASFTVNSTAVQSDGKIIVGGGFTLYNGTPKNAIIRLNSNGTLDAGFITGTGLNGAPGDIKIQSDNKIILAGGFTAYNGTMRSSILRMNSDGTLDTGFDPGSGTTNGSVNSVSLQADGKIVAGGQFTLFNGTYESCITRLNTDGTLDGTFNPVTGSNWIINTLNIQTDDKIIIGGTFTKYNDVTRNRIARLNADGTLDLTFNPGSGASDIIYTSLLQSDGKIIIGGKFTTYNGTSINRIARLNTDGTLDGTFTVGTGASGGDIRAMAMQSDGKIIITGEFTSYNGTARNRIARVNTDGTLDATFNPGTGMPAGNTVYAVAIQSDGKIIIGGTINSYNGTIRRNILRVNTDGSLDAPFTATGGPGGDVQSITVLSSGKMIVGGGFFNYSGYSIQRLVRINADGTVDLTFATGIGADGPVYKSIEQADGKILVAGIFYTINNAAAGSIARLNSDGTMDASFRSASGSNQQISAMALQSDGKIIIGGLFTGYQNVGRNRIARILNTTCTAPAVTGTTPGSRCGAGTVTLSATASSGTLYWYNAQNALVGSGSPFTTPSISFTNTFYVQASETGCPSARTAVTATVSTTPTVSGTTPGSTCGTGTVILGASSSGTLNWYAASSGGASLGTGTSFTTPSISSTTTYYVDATTGGCTSARTAVTATVSTTPSISGTTPNSRCGTGTVGLGATASAGTLNWYAASSGGSSLGTGTSFTTPSISSTTTYYVDAASGGCTSARTAVTATVNTTPSISGSTPASRCDAGTLALSATASAGTLNWYAASSGGASLGTGTTFNTPAISSTTTYYVDATSAGCTSLRTAVIATVNTTPSITGTTPDSRCGAGTLSIGATADAGTLAWYTASSGGASLGTGNSFTTPSISGTTTYYVESTSSGCTSARSAVLATVNIIDNTLALSGSTITANETGASYKWLDCNNGNSQIPGETNQSYTASSSGDFAVVVTKNGCSDTSNCMNITLLAIQSGSVSNNVLIAPNPGNGIITVETQKIAENIMITDSQGKMVMRMVPLSTSTVIDIQTHAAGIYFIHLQYKDRSEIVKFSLY
jgi:uncharacterized delta-60 repeat protein